MITISFSKTGPLYSEFNGKKLQSAYDPVREAERFVDTKLGGKKPGKIILLGASLGYIRDYIRKLFPTIEILTVYYHNFFYTRFAVSNGKSCLFTNPDDLRVFFNSHIHDIDLECLEIIEWPASASLFPAISKMVQETLHNLILQYHGNFLTTAGFGKRWIINSIKNYLFQQSCISIDTIRKPIFIAAAGPSLEKSFSFLKQYKNKFFLIALPSAVLSLSSMNIPYDAVMITDPGYYTSVHFPCGMKNQSFFVIKSLSSSFLSAQVSVPTLLFSQNLPLENELLSMIYGKFLQIPSNGTVAGSALDFALMHKPPSIIFAGLDLQFQDIHSHVKPHSFDTLFSVSSNRVSPYISNKFSRAFSFKESSRSFKSYSQWLQTRVCHSPVPVYRLFPVSNILSGFQSLTYKSAAELIKDLPVFQTERFSATELPFSQRIRSVKAILLEYIAACESFQRQNLEDYLIQLKHGYPPAQVIYFTEPILIKNLKRNKKNFSAALEKVRIFLLYLLDMVSVND